MVHNLKIHDINLTIINPNMVSYCCWVFLNFVHLGGRLTFKLRISQSLAMARWAEFSVKGFTLFMFMLLTALY